MTAIPSNLSNEIELWLTRAKKLMEWDENRFGEPTLLEYLRHYKSGVIKEKHIESAIEAHLTTLFNEQIVAGKLEELQRLPMNPNKSWPETIKERIAILNKELEGGAE